jgi:lipoate-protein ligase A
VDAGALKTYGWEVVRRPTGGRAILHVDELTYSIAAPLDEPRLAGSLLESYQRISLALIAALESLGLPVQALEKPQLIAANGDPEQNLESIGPVCFEVPSNYEITVEGKKLIGSAQARRREGVLQHGSLPLYGDLTRITRILRYPDEHSRRLAAERLLARAITVEAVLGHILAWEACSQVFVCAFQEVLGLELITGELSLAERRRAEQLVIEKYAHPDWTERV